YDGCAGFQRDLLFSANECGTLFPESCKEVTMIPTIFPCLPDATLSAVNTVGQWLAQDDLQSDRPGDVVILTGNAVIPTVDAACGVSAEQNVPLLISGGVAHSATLLYAAIAQHPRYSTLPTTGRAEAAILADIATRSWKIPAERVQVEDQATN